MFNNLKNILIGIFATIIVVAVGASAYTAFASPDVDQIPAPAAAISAGQGNGNGNGNGTGTSVLDIPASDLDSEETAALLFIREEEKLARDVYNALYEIWGQPTFTNIASSEQKHMDEIKLLLDRYNLADPAREPGSFTDSNLQALYNQLVTQGSVSLADALKVGATIEEIDILDLQERIAQTDIADIQQAYNNLMLGSYNHLNAFVGALSMQTGEAYVPQYLSTDAYTAIVTSQSGNGYSNGGQAAGQGGGGYRGGQNGSSAGNSTVVPSTESGVPQAQVNLAGVSTINGTVSAYDLVNLTIATSDGQTVVVQLGNSFSSQSIGFNPAIGAQVRVSGFPGDQGLFSATTVTVNGQTYAFRDDLGRPLWSGGNGKGNGRGGNH